jgi:hypothetical protein
MIRTIPDTIDLIKLKYKRFVDVPLSWMESIGSKMNSFAWNKRWANREKGTGYKSDRTH